MKRLWGVLIVLALAAGVCPALADVPAHDRAGNAIDAPQSVRKIIALSPSVVQVVLDLGMGDRLVAVDTYSESTKALPEGVQAFDMMAPDLERIVQLAPDVVFVTGMSLVEGEDPLAKLPEYGICVAYIPSSESIEGILADTLFVGRMLGAEAAATALNKPLKDAAASMRVETDDPVPVYFEVGHEPQLYSFGAGTFLDEMIDLLGGVNILKDQPGWNAPSEETVIKAAPEIIFTNETWREDPAAEIMAREGWQQVPAVADGRVYAIDADASSQANHRVVKALEQMAEAFAELAEAAPAA